MLTPPHETILPGTPAPQTPDRDRTGRREQVRRNGALDDLDFVESSGSFHGGPNWKKSGYALVAWSFVASIIDACVVVGLACLFMVVVLFIAKMGGEFLTFDRAVILNAVFILFVFLHVTYLLSLRVILGHSLGEWACGLKLGEPHARLSPRYSLKVLWRFVIVAATGVLVLPILSYLTGKDWAGRLSGLPLISLVKGTRI
ncbi:MAG: RDD family protein [Bdellovibrio sp.]|jgi:hypothetical protein